MKSQHQAKRLALQGLSCMDARNGKEWDLAKEFLEESRDPSYVVKKALKIIEDVREDEKGCDEILSRNAHRWDINRLALVDRNILRLATYEMRNTKEQVATIISDALKLATEFSTAESPRFINGILDAVGKELAASTPEENPTEGSID